jgi:tryptophan-rich sensory protein
MNEKTARWHAIRRDLIGLGGFLVLCFAVSGLGAAATATSVGSWYQALEKPSFNPPDWVFAPVWTTLFILMAIAGWRIWRGLHTRPRTIALVVFAVQLGLNLTWSVLFFGLQSIGGALVDIALLLTAIVTTATLFWRIEWIAGALLVPYAIWVAYALLLNASIWLLN